MDAPRAPESSELRIGGRYVLGEPIGSGGMATVHLGRDLQASDEGGAVAIKRLHPRLAAEPEFVATLLDEGRIVSRIQHPNVVPLHEVVFEGQDIFLVLEYVRGESVSALLRALRAASGRVPVDVACAITHDVLRGLHAAHEATDEQGRPLGVVHRDVSPHNVIVGVDGRARLLDFGLAKAAGRSQSTRPGQIKGKLRYMPPEQLRGGHVTRRSDLFSTGVVLREMLTLDRTKGDPTDAEAMLELLARDRGPASLGTDVPAPVAAVIARATALEASARYATAEEMAQDLARAHGAASQERVASWQREVTGAPEPPRAPARPHSLRAASPAPTPAGMIVKAVVAGAVLLILVLLAALFGRR